MGTPITLDNFDQGFILSVRNDDFAISPRTGQIYTRTELDYETKKEYKFEVMATLIDKVLRTNVIVRINNLNDNVPVFEKYFEMVKLKWSPNMPLLTVKASDADVSTIINYGLVNSVNYFRLNETVLMTTTMKPSKLTNKITITASDGLHTANMIAMVDFIDSQVQATFSSAFRTFMVSECSPTPYIVGQLVIDGDEESFVFWSSRHAYFSIEKQSGFIIKHSSIDYERYREFTFDVYARSRADNQGPTIQTKIMVKVQDCVERGPEMISPKVFPISVGKLILNENH